VLPPGQIAHQEVEIHPQTRGQTGQDRGEARTVALTAGSEMEPAHTPENSKTLSAKPMDTLLDAAGTLTVKVDFSFPMRRSVMEKKKRKKVKKLSLTKETLRELAGQDMKKAGGGVATSMTCANSVCRSCYTCFCA